MAKLFADAAVNPLTYIGGIALAVKIVSVVGDTDLVIGLLAALPVVGLTALSKSPVGKRVMANLEAQLPGAAPQRQAVPDAGCWIQVHSDWTVLHSPVLQALMWEAQPCKRTTCAAHMSAPATLPGVR